MGQAPDPMLMLLLIAAVTHVGGDPYSGMSIKNFDVDTFERRELPLYRLLDAPKELLDHVRHPAVRSIRGRSLGGRPVGAAHAERVGGGDGPRAQQW